MEHLPEGGGSIRKAQVAEKKPRGEKNHRSGKKRRCLREFRHHHVLCVRVFKNADGEKLVAPISKTMMMKRERGGARETREGDCAKKVKHPAKKS